MGFIREWGHRLITRPWHRSGLSFRCTPNDDCDPARYNQLSVSRESIGRQLRSR